MKGLDVTAGILMTVMVLGPLALAPAYGPYVAPGTATEVNEATTPLEEGSANVEEGGVTDPQPVEPARDAG